MTNYVVVKKLKDATRKDLPKAAEWQKQFDQWLKEHGAKFESVKHFLCVIGDEMYESWYSYPDISALDADGELADQFADDPAWQRLNAQGQELFERVSSRILKQL